MPASRPFIAKIRPSVKTRIRSRALLSGPLAKVVSLQHFSVSKRQRSDSGSASASGAASQLIERKEMGRRLRSARKQRNLTLKEVSDRCGVSLATVSKMELGQLAMSYEKFVAVTGALGIDVAELFEVESASQPGFASVPFSHTVLAKAPLYEGEHYEHRMLNVDFPAKSMTPAYGRIRSRSLAEFATYNRHPGQEFLLVLTGALKVCFETGEHVDLQAGESLYFDSGRGHVYLSMSEEDAYILMVMSRPD